MTPLVLLLGTAWFLAFAGGVTFVCLLPFAKRVSDRPFRIAQGIGASGLLLLVAVETLVWIGRLLAH